MISVIIPLYNKQNSIVSTLESALNQSYKHFEIIIINDGSSDYSAEEVKKFSDKRIRLIHQNNQGAAMARNRGIASSHGRWIAFLDADDKWEPDYLETQWNLHLKYPNCKICACSYKIINDKNKVALPKINRLKFRSTDSILNNYLEVAANGEPPFFTSSVMIKKSALLEIGGFPSGINSGEDLLTWVRLSLKNQIAYSSQNLVIYNNTKLATPKRKITQQDSVGEALKELYAANKTKYLARYISYWHKMRCNIFIMQSNKILAFREATKSLKYNILNTKTYIYIALLILPKKIVRHVIKN